MVLPLIVGLSAFLGLGFFAVNAAATLFHWISIGSALVIAAGLFYQLVVSDILEFVGFDSEYFETLAAGAVASVVGFVSFRLIEAVFTTLGWLSALMALVLIGASVWLGPALVAQIIGGLIGFIFDAVGGE